VLVLAGRRAALGSYQAGAYQGACVTAGFFEPEWIAGISIGAQSTAANHRRVNPPEKSSWWGRLKEFWEMVSAPVPWNPVTKGDPRAFPVQ